MKKKIQSQVLKEVLEEETIIFNKKSTERLTKELMKKAISRTIELMEEQNNHAHIKPNCKLCFSMWRNGKENAEADFRKLIVLEKIIVRRMCLGLAHPLEKNQKKFTKWLQNTVNFHLDQLHAKINGGEK